MKYDFTTVLNRFNCGSTKWEEMKNYGITDVGIVPLSNAEMEFKNAPEIRKGLAEFIENTVMSYYTPEDGLYEAVQSWFSRRHGYEMEREHILPNHNIHVASSTVVEAFTEPGDGVIVMQPVWPGFFGAAEEQGRKLVVTDLINTDGYYEIDYDDFEAKCREEKNKLVLFCSPHNPAGRVWKREELQRVADICCRNNVLIVSDELHCDIVRPGYKHIPIATLSDEVAMNTITFLGCSKAFNIAGLDASAIIIKDEKKRKRYVDVRNSRGMTRANMLGVKAMEIALKTGEEWLTECNAVIDENAAYVESFVRDNMPKIRCTHLEGTYLMWLDLRALGLDVHVMEKSLMQDAKLFMDDGFYFGDCGNGFERLNIAVPFEVLKDAMARLKNWYDGQ